MALKDKILKGAQAIRYRSREGREHVYSEVDLDYMSSLSAAVLQKSAASTQIILWSLFSVTLVFLLWSALAEVDEITRGEGKVIPSSQLQKISNLEGGIVAEILVKEGDEVDVGQVLLRIDDIGFDSKLKESQISQVELSARVARLKAEAEGGAFEIDPALEKSFPQIVASERSLLASHKEQLQSLLGTLREQHSQKTNELIELQAAIKQMERSVALIMDEVKITEPLVKNGIVSEVEFLKLKRQANDATGDMENKRNSIPRVRSTIEEINKKIHETELNYQNLAKKEYNEANAELKRIQETQGVLKDRVSRTAVKSPVKGNVNRLLVNTIGGVIQPGMDMIEIVPLNDNLLIEARIKPADIAFIHPGQRAVVKFTAYDFSIHGGLAGEVVFISSDTIHDEKKNEDYYLVRIKTDKNFLGREEKPMPIIVGMATTVDILTGKKTILGYLLKPIFKAKSNALSER